VLHDYALYKSTFTLLYFTMHCIISQCETKTVQYYHVQFSATMYVTKYRGRLLTFVNTATTTMFVTNTAIYTAVRL